LRGKCVGGPGKKDKNQRREPKKPYGFHTMRRRLNGEWLP
jgi:hypothetical protein